MILYIDQNYQWQHDFVPSNSKQEIDNWNEYVREACKTANRFTCHYNVKYTDTGILLKLYQQKCTLNEVDMNTLFNNFITNFFDIDLQYGYYGGEGCDFSIVLKATSLLEE